ncbi:FAD-binding protein [Candidatus Gracilibacteria bacterium 28_42_T64]|nr:FAD-binding protein [Candidatus Gracilibacteria bacterium 28_42_T64]
MKFDYDVIVIGSGSGGLTVSIGLAGAGKKVALIEKGFFGGDCTNFGCVPSKAFIDIAKKGHHKDIKGVLEEVRKRRQVIRDEETKEKLEKYGMKVISGFASFKDKNTVLIDGEKEITAKNIVISTGSHANIVPIEGLDKKDIFTNENVFELEENIKELVIIGGGYIGCELAESFANSNVNVTILQRNKNLIPREEGKSSELLEKIFESKGIKICKNTTALRAEGKELVILDKDGKKERKIPFDKVLIALGRGANVNGLDMKNANIKFDQKGITIDKFNRTSSKNIYAIGDCVKGNPQFTHLANNEGRGVIRNILVPFLKKSVKKSVLPAVLYTNTEIARVGKTGTELLKYYSKDDIVTKTLYFSGNDRSKLTDDEVGFVKINFKRVSGKILGATIAGTKAGEMLPILVSAMENNISAYKISKTIFAYPTKAELIKKVCDSFVIHTLGNIKNEAKYYIKDNILQVVTATIWFIIIFSFFYYKKMNNLDVEQIAINIYNFISGNMAIGPFIYILFYAIRPVVLFPATLMTFMSGALFGPWLGIAFTLVGENMSAAFAYFLGTVFGKKIIGPDSHGGLVDDLKSKANESPFMTILMTRLLFFPFDLVNYISGFLRINFKGFFLATLIGIIPGASVFVIAGSAFHNQKIESFSQAISDIDITMLYFAAILFIITIVLAKVLKKRQVKV